MSVCRAALANLEGNLVTPREISRPTKMTKNSERTEIEAEEASMATWDCGSPLYDSYELVSLDHLIQRHLMVIPSLGRSKRLSSNYYYQYDVQDTSSLAVTRGMPLRHSGLASVERANSSGQARIKTFKVVKSNCRVE
ncbi:hypothetical protein WN943_017559 [Citrus x changshan-huyou]